jgi:hypothetical protein
VAIVVVTGVTATEARMSLLQGTPLQGISLEVAIPPVTPSALLAVAMAAMPITAATLVLRSPVLGSREDRASVVATCSTPMTPSRLCEHRISAWPQIPISHSMSCRK